jgi:hypothetical protein
MSYKQAPKNSQANDSIVRLYVDGQGYFQGVLVEVSSGALVVDFPLSEAPELAVKKEVQLSLSTDRLSSSLKLTAMTAYRGEDEYRCRYRFDISSDVHIALSTLIDGRGNCRVTPGSEVRIEVLFKDDEKDDEIFASLEDASKTGLSLAATLCGDAPFPIGHKVSMRFSLLGDREPLNLSGVIRHHKKHDMGILFGIEFDHRAAARFPNDLDRFTGFVMRRQVDLLKQFGVSSECIDWQL